MNYNDIKQQHFKKIIKTLGFLVCHFKATLFNQKSPVTTLPCPKRGNRQINRTDITTFRLN